MADNTQDEPSHEQRLMWGAQLAEIYNISFPELATTFRTYGLSMDPTSFIQAIEGNTDTLPIACLAAMLHIIEMVTKNAREKERVQAEYSGEQEKYVESLSKRIDDSQNYINNLRRELDTRDFTINALIQATNNRDAPPVPTHALRRNTEDPEKFGGDEKDMVKKQDNYLQWKKALQLNHITDKEFFKEERDKVLHVIGCLNGTAARNNAMYIDSVLHHPNDIKLWKWNTVQYIFQKLDEQYQTINLKQVATIKFDKLFQHNTPFPQFLAEFHSLAISSGKNDEQMVEALKKKVSKGMALKFSNMEDPPAPDDFASWTTKGNKFWDNIVEFEHNFENKGEHNHQKGQTGNQPRTTSNGGDAMDLSRMKISKLSDADWKFCRENNLCFFCRLPGHSIGECKKRKRLLSNDDQGGRGHDNSRNSNSSRERSPGSNTGRGGYQAYGGYGQQTRGGYNQAPYGGFRGSAHGGSNRGGSDRGGSRLRVINDDDPITEWSTVSESSYISPPLPVTECEQSQPHHRNFQQQNRDFHHGEFPREPYPQYPRSGKE